jgi:hypothetical protein
MNYKELEEDNEYLVSTFQVEDDPSLRSNDYIPGLRVIKVIRTGNKSNIRVWVLLNWNLNVIENITSKP